MGGQQVNAGIGWESAALVLVSVPGDGGAGGKMMVLGDMGLGKDGSLGVRKSQVLRKCLVIQFSCGSFLQVGPRSSRLHLYRALCPCPSLHAQLPVGSHDLSPLPSLFPGTLHLCTCDLCILLSLPSLPQDPSKGYVLSMESVSPTHPV